MEEEVVKEIFWLPTAKLTFNHIIEYLQNHWTDKEVEKFMTRTEEVLAILKRFPEMSRPSLKRKNVRIVILNRHTKMVYHYKPKKKQLEILLFWGMKQNPSKFKY